MFTNERTIDYNWYHTNKDTDSASDLHNIYRNQTKAMTG